MNEAGYENFNGQRFPAFKKDFLNEARIYGDLTIQLYAGRPLIRHRPEPTDFYLAADQTPTSMKKYDLTSGGDLTADSKKAYRDDMRMYDLIIIQDGQMIAKFVTLLLKRCTVVVLSTLASHGERYTLAHKTNDYFTIWQLLEESYSTGNTAVVLNNFTDLFELKQGEDQHEVYLEKFYAATKLVTTDLDSEEHPGYFKADVIFSAIYLHGLDTLFFGPKIETLYESSEKLNDVNKLTKDFQTYKLKKILPTATTTTTQPTKQSTPHVPTTLNNEEPTTKPCNNCGVTMTIPPGKFFWTLCSKCRHEDKARRPDRAPNQLLADTPDWFTDDMWALDTDDPEANL
jgi:hypothetical protein